MAILGKQSYSHFIHRLEDMRPVSELIGWPSYAHQHCSNISGSHRDRVVKRADFMNALYHSIIWCGLELHTRHMTCETSQVLFVGVPGVFSRGSPVLPHLLIGPSLLS